MGHEGVPKEVQYARLRSDGFTRTHLDAFAVAAEPCVPWVWCFARLFQAWPVDPP